MNSFIRLLRYAKPYKGRLAWAVLAMVLYAVASALVIFLIRRVIDNVLPSGEGLRMVALALVALYFVKGVGSYFSGYLMEDVGQRVVMDLRDRLYGHILGQSASFFARNTSGQLLSRVSNDVGQVQRAVSETAGDLLRESLALVGYAVILIWIDWRLALVCLTGAPIIIYPLVRLGQRIRRTARRSQEAQEVMSHVGSETFSAHRIVKAFGAEEREAARFRDALRHLYRTNMRVVRALSLMPPFMELLGGIGMAVALWYGSTEIAAGRLTTGQFTSFLAALLMMYAPAKKLSRVNANVQQAIAAGDRIFEMIDTHTEVAESPNARVMPPFTSAIEFRDVSFAYEDAHPRAILRHVSFTVPAGQMVAIVGRSGAGKTTLVNLIPRFYDVGAGSIVIDGRDIREVTLKSLRAQVGFVTQETVLFDDTIANNIAYGALRANVPEIEAVAKAAHAHDFIAALPDGYQTRIGERGQKLSGGQRQRVAIARALLKNAPVLILDEATSALDTEAELLVQDALATLMLNRTSFVIAHRLSTIMRADAIIVLERGRIVEIGRHDDLLSRDGIYASLYKMQLLEPRREVSVNDEPRAANT
ncbi:MAG TPA: lipid A export permease/ATP-binding protein MsbA [Vicinamibacterales bacterium]|nr:lipid A export permease/ATP-binding protein MsbA [Vicinamibacterales bacterium]